MLLSSFLRAVEDWFAARMHAGRPQISMTSYRSRLTQHHMLHPRPISNSELFGPENSRLISQDEKEDVSISYTMASQEVGTIIICLYKIMKVLVLGGILCDNLSIDQQQ